jgi:hypothetical protein
MHEGLVMRTLAILAIGAASAGSWFVAHFRAVPREARVSVEVRDGVLKLHGTLKPLGLPRFRRDVRLFSTAPDGDLAIRRLTAADAEGQEVSASQTVAETKATTIVLSPLAAQFDVDVDLNSVVSGNTSVGYANEDGSALALPLRRFLFGAETDRIKVLVDASKDGLVASELLARGLYLAGAGWREFVGDAVDVLAGPEVSAAIGERVAVLTHRALSRLAQTDFPNPRVRPIVLLVNETRDDAFARFDLPPESEIYVVQCRSGVLLESGVFRDLASAAVTRLRSARPKSEHLLWTSIEGSLAVRLGIEAGLAAAEEQRRAAKRGYEANDRFQYAPAVTPNSFAPYYWFIRESINVHLWELFWEDVTQSTAKSWDGWMGAVTTHPQTGVGDVTRNAFGPKLADRFHELMEVGGWHVPAAHATEPNSFPGNGTAAVVADQTGKATDDITLVLTGVNLGFLDNCGCTKNQGGGVARRKVVIDEVRTAHPDSIVLDLGDTLSPPLSGKSRDAGSDETLMSALRATAYDGLVPGVAELGHDAKWFRDAAAANGLRYFAANVRDRRSGERAFPPVMTLERGERTVHVLGLVEVPYERYYLSAIEARVYPQYELTSPVECARALLASASKEEIWCVAGTLTPETTESLLASDVADRIDAILTASWRVGRLLAEDTTTGTRTYLREPVATLYGRTAYLFSAFERFAVTVGTFALDGTGGFDQVAIAIKDMPSTVARDVGIEQILARYAGKQAGEPTHWPLTPVYSLPEEQRGDAGYVGVASCAGCHPKETESWRQSLHSRAINSLAGKTKENDVACLRCHTTGFHWRDGFDPRTEARRALEQVQCEVCHGPGKVHLSIHAAGGTAQADTIRRSPTRAVCMSCHDDQNSPAFDFEAGIAHVRH